MRKHYVVLAILAALSSAIFSPARAQDNCPQPSAKLKLCSYTALNEDCLLTIDRKNPITSPTIYVARKHTVTVVVCHPSPLEELSFDWKSSTLSVPQDVFQNLAQALQGYVGKIEIISEVVRRNPERHILSSQPPQCENENDVDQCTKASDISLAQARVNQQIADLETAYLNEASNSLQDIHAALQYTAGDAPWFNWPAWAAKQSSALSSAIEALPKPKTLNDISLKIATLSQEVDSFKKAHPQNDSEALQLATNQTNLQNAFASLQKNVDAATAKLTALEARIDQLEKQNIAASITFQITESKDCEKLSVGAGPVSESSNPSHVNGGDLTIACDINYSNKLAATIDRIAANPIPTPDEYLLANLAKAPAKQKLLTVNIQFQSQPRIELASGLLLPMAPYHGYAKAAVSSGGAITDNVVQETKTWAVVPMEFVNFPFKQWIARQQASALFATGGVGYNSVMSNVNYGAGLTFSYRAFAISALADIGTDTKLSGGFTVGQSLGTSSPPTPATTNYWTAKAAIAISVRIPLGGGK